MNRTLLFIICLNLLMLTGCTNRPGGPWGSNARVPAPGTYQLKIPSLANNQPYYTPNQGSLVAANPIVNPNNPAPVINPPVDPAQTNRVADANLQGWKLINGTTQPQVPNQSNAPIYQSPYVVGNRAALNAPNYQVASGSTLTSSTGSTVAAQPNMMPVDASRMAAIDASGIRPPAVVAPQQFLGNLQTTGVAAQGFQRPVVNQNGFIQPQNPNSMPNRFAAQPVVGTPGAYQSPYIRQGGTFVQGFDPRGNGNTGWVAREGSPGTSR